MIKKIAVLRANALGDYIFVLPALQALREHFPEAEIVYLGKDWHSEYLTSRPGPVDRVIVIPPYPGITEKEGFIPNQDELDVFFTEMQKEAFDIAFQLHGGGKNSNPFILRLEAKRTVGLKTPDAAALDISVPYVYYFSETLRYLEVVSKVGAKTTAIEPVVAVTANDITEANSVLHNPEKKPIAVIHPGASDLRRRWPGENFAKIADFLIEKGYLVCITGISSENHILKEFLSKWDHDVQNLCGKLTLSGMTGLLSKASLLVSNDTGPLHLARALKTPTVGIYWFSNIVTGLQMSTSIHRSLVSFTVNCPLCGLSSTKFNQEDPGICKHETSFVADVTVEDVQAALLELMDLKEETKTINFTTRQEVIPIENEV